MADSNTNVKHIQPWHVVEIFTCPSCGAQVGDAGAVGKMSCPACGCDFPLPPLALRVYSEQGPPELLSPMTGRQDRSQSQDTPFPRPPPQVFEAPLFEPPTAIVPSELPRRRNRSCPINWWKACRKAATPSLLATCPNPVSQALRTNSCVPRRSLPLVSISVRTPSLPEISALSCERILLPATN